MKRFILLTVSYLFSLSLHAQSIADRVQHIVDSFYKVEPASIGIMVHVESPGQHISWSYAVGYSDKDTKTKLSPEQPVLVASNTKTYVAASILKLVELNNINLDQPIDSIVNKKTRELLLKKGYNVRDITIRHLLSHTSGIDDYVNDDYFDFVNRHRKYKWTRDEQIALAMKVGKPLGAPADTFRYADVNYLLLSEIIEHCTGKPFCQSVKELIGFKKLHLASTWFVDLQSKPAKTNSLAHQYWDKYPWDSYDLDASWDLYGGGGIAATTKDMAVFFQQLFEGNIIHDKEVLQQMYTDVPCKTKTNYCLGIRKISMAGLTGYYHGGFWGTDIIYFPELNTSISICILEKSKRDLSADICKAVVGLIGK